MQAKIKESLGVEEEEKDDFHPLVADEGRIQRRKLKEVKDKRDVLIHNKTIHDLKKRALQQETKKVMKVLSI